MAHQIGDDGSPIGSDAESRLSHFRCFEVEGSCRGRRIRSQKELEYENDRQMLRKSHTFSLLRAECEDHISRRAVLHADIPGSHVDHAARNRRPWRTQRTAIPRNTVDCLELTIGRETPSDLAGRINRSKYSIPCAGKNHSENGARCADLTTVIRLQLGRPRHTARVQ